MVARELISHESAYFSENGSQSFATAKLCDCNVDDLNTIGSKYVPRARFEKMAQKSII